MGQKKLAVLTRVFCTRKCMAVFARRPKKVAVITRWPCYRGGRKAGFHCNMCLETGYSTKKSSNSSIVLCVLRDACHELFCVFGYFHASGTEDAEVTKSLKLSAQRFLGSFGWPSVTYDWIVVALNTVDLSKLALLPTNYPRNHCAQSLGEKIITKPSAGPTNSTRRIAPRLWLEWIPQNQVVVFTQST